MYIQNLPYNMCLITICYMNMSDCSHWNKASSSLTKRHPSSLFQCGFKPIIMVVLMQCSSKSWSWGRVYVYLLLERQSLQPLEYVLKVPPLWDNHFLIYLHRAVYFYFLRLFVNLFDTYFCLLPECKLRSSTWLLVFNLF